MYSYLVRIGVHVQYTKMHTITLSVCTSTEQKIKFPIFPVARNLTFPPPILQRIEEIPIRHSAPSSTGLVNSEFKIQQKAQTEVFRHSMTEVYMRSGYVIYK